MKKFIKGNLETIVEDGDRRIPEYLANGWKEVALDTKAGSSRKSATEKALGDVAESEGGNKTPGKSEGKGKGKTNRVGKTGEADKKVNDAIEANSNAAAEENAVDDGLFDKKDGD